MSLDYEGLRKLSKDRAVEDAKLLFPPGNKRKDAEYRLEHKYYAEYTTPPFRFKEVLSNNQY